MKLIPLSRGLFSKVDDEDYGKVCGKRWTAQKVGRQFYAARYEGKKYVMMHRLIMDTPKGLEVDHVDHDGLNNQKSNLRNVTRRENLLNIGFVDVPKTSNFRGVHRRADKWRVMASVNDKTVHLGTFDNEIEAAEAYLSFRG